MIDLIAHCGLYCPNWEFIPDYTDTTKNRIVLEEEGTRKYLSNFGDGIRYSMELLSILDTLKDTSIFIEEPESHQHSGQNNEIRVIESGLFLRYLLQSTSNFNFP